MHEESTTCSPWRLSVAPMMDATDRHCRYFHRLLTRRGRLYTEMVTTGALLHGDVRRHLDFSPEEHPLALQLGGSEPSDLAACAKLGERWGYDEINLNCGCPSKRVQRGAFGACLMADPALVAECVKAMRDATSLPVSVKHRIGIDRGESYAFVRDFVGTLAAAGCEVFIVHARNAWLDGLSPKENRELPPLRHDVVARLKRDFAALTIVANGGLRSHADIEGQLRHVDGVMLGRHAYHEPWAMASWDEAHFGESGPALTREQVLARFVEYLEARSAAGNPWLAAMRHALGLYNGVPGARLWRRTWSDPWHKHLAPREVAKKAARTLQQAHTVAARVPAG